MLALEGMRTFAAFLSMGAVCLCVTIVVAQPAGRRATTIAALKSFPGFYNLRTVQVIGDVRGMNNSMSIGTDETSIRMVARENPQGRIEARGQLLDIGRISRDDPRLIPFNLLDLVLTSYPDRWPRPGEELILVLSSTVPPPSAADITTPPLRTLAMEPEKFEGQPVTIVGQFRGRNLFGDLPAAPLSDKWQFVLRATNAAVWVVGLEPKGKGFNFDPNRRFDTGRWVKVSGTARTAGGLTWLEGKSIILAEAPEETVEVVIAAPPPPAVEVVFVVPTADEIDVRLDERIRFQFSRDVDPTTVEGHIRLTYPDGTEIAFEQTYRPENRVLDVQPAAPWERFRTVKIELLEGILGTDGGAIVPFTLTFTTGGS